MGNLIKAEEYQLKCLKIEEQNFGQNCIQSASTLGNLGNIYQTMGNLIKAEEYQLKSLKIKEYNFGKNCA